MSELQQQAAAGVRWTAISTVIRVAVQLIQLAIIARFVSAEDLGLFALLQLVFMLGGLFLDMGLSQSIIHHDKLARKDLNQLGTLVVLVALSISAGMALLASGISAFFSSPGLESLIVLMSPVFLIMGISRVNLAVLQKALLFKSVAITELVALSISTALTLYLVFENHGVLALLAGLVVNQTVLALFYVLLDDGRVYWALPKSLQTLKKHLHFGAYKTLDTLVNYFNSQMDVLLVGKMFGTEVLGGYNLVRQFCMRPAMLLNPVVTRVAFPYMSRLKESDQLTATYQRILNILSALNFPVYIALFVLAEPVVEMMFGTQWLHLASVMRLLAIWCLIRSCLNPVGALLMAIGKVRRALLWNTFLLIGFPIGLYFAALGGELLHVAVTLLLLQIATAVGHWYFLVYGTISMSASAFLGALVRAFGISGVTGVLVYPVVLWADAFSAQGIVAVALSVGGVIYAGLSWRFNPFLVQMLRGDTLNHD